MAHPTSFARLAGVLVPCALLSSACGGDVTGPPRLAGGLHASVGANVTDTVDARLPQALVMQLADPNGAPVSGAVVRYSAVAVVPPLGGPATPSALVTPLDREQPGTFATDTSDARGETGMLITLGAVAGPAFVVVTAPTLGLVDTVRYTVTPGGVARLVFTPHDTATTLGAQISLRALVTDRRGNARPEAASLTASGAIASVDAAGRATAGSTVGRGVVRATFAGMQDSATVSVVPAGRLVAVRNGDVGLVNLDGSGYTRVITAPGANFPAVNRAGTQVAYHEYTATGYQQIILVDVATGARRLLLDPSVIISAVHPRYSADGSYIYFAARRTLNVQPGIWRARPDGSGLEEVVPPGAASYTEPDPSPDGTEVAFVDLYSNHVVVKTLATGAMRTTALLGVFPRYSPDGSMLASYSGTLNVMNVDGTGLRVLSVPAVSGDGGLTWCPNGACLVMRGFSGLSLTVLSTGQSMDLGVNRDRTYPSF